MIGLILLVVFIKISVHYNNPLVLAGAYTVIAALVSSTFEVQAWVLLVSAVITFWLMWLFFWLLDRYEDSRHMVGSCYCVSCSNADIEFASMIKHLSGWLFENFCYPYKKESRAKFFLEHFSTGSKPGFLRYGNVQPKPRFQLPSFPHFYPQSFPKVFHSSGCKPLQNKAIVKVVSA